MLEEVRPGEQPVPGEDGYESKAELQGTGTLRCGRLFAGRVAVATNGFELALHLGPTLEGRDVCGSAAVGIELDVAQVDAFALGRDDGHGGSATGRLGHRMVHWRRATRQAKPCPGCTSDFVARALEA